MILNEKQLKSISKFLSFILRHHPEQIGITLDKDGWVDIDTLLTQVNHPEHGFTGNPLTSTAQVQVEHKVATPPQILYHGTAERSVPSILEQGLHSASRHFVHLSADAATAVNVGSRHGKPLVLTIDTVAMLAAGHQFYLADNGVWLTENVPPQFIGKL